MVNEIITDWWVGVWVGWGGGGQAMINWDKDCFVFNINKFS